GLLDSVLVREELPPRLADEAPRPRVSSSRLAIPRHRRDQDLIEEALERAREPAPHVSVAADDGGDVGDLAGELGIQRRVVEARPLPRVDQRELPPGAQRPRSDRPQPAQEPHAEEADDRRSPDVLAKARAPLGPPALAEAGDGTGDDGGQDAVDLV